MIICSSFKYYKMSFAPFHIIANFQHLPTYFLQMSTQFRPNSRKQADFEKCFSNFAQLAHNFVHNGRDFDESGTTWYYNCISQTFSGNTYQNFAEAYYKFARKDALLIFLQMVISACRSGLQWRSPPGRCRRTRLSSWW